jgi:N utilization substance protein A
VNLKAVVDELIEERGIDRATLEAIVCEGMLAAYQRKYPDVVFSITYDHATGTISIEGEKTVVSTVQDDDGEISLKKARFITKEIQVSDKILLPFEGKIGRVEVLYARQVIAQQIRTVEAAVVFNEYKQKQGDIVHGSVHKCERSGMVIKLDDGMLAFLPNTAAISSDKCVVGLPLRCLLKEVLTEPRNDHQIILDRISSDFMKKLLELEVPEIFERLVEIKKIVRIAGYKTKVAVVSCDKNIDPVGTCVGVGGSRIKPILNELGGEKIDVLLWSDSIEERIKGSLKPAKINRVEIDEKNAARVWVDEDQRSFAIGKSGQNIALASRLVGLEIQLMGNDSSAPQVAVDESPSETW